ncbi:MAG: NAD(P)-dependent oxidoreductase [Shimia sp.]
METPMKVLVFGASGRTGRPLAERLVAAGHTVTSLGRTDPGIPGVTHVAGDPRKAADVAPLAAQADAVASALASSNADPVCSQAARAVIDAAEGRALRFLTVAGAGVDAPGDAKGVPDKIVGAIMKVVVGKMLADRQKEHGMLTASPLAWTMLRPPRLTTEEPTGRWTFSDDKPAATKIARGDLAGAMVEALGRADMHRKAPFVSAAKG